MDDFPGQEVGVMNEKTDEPEISQRSKAKLMDPGKLAFVQRYLEGVQNTRSVMTEAATDSGLATHTAASELGTDEINERDKLCFKDLSSDVMTELKQRLLSDKTAMGNFYQFFGLKMGDQYWPTGMELTDVKELFPDTTVNMLKECFEALRMYDLAEIMEKVRPRSLRPALSPEQIERLWKAGDRRTKFHSDVAVLVVKHSVKGDIVEMEDAEKVETFFKDLNSRNEVTIISLASSQETREALRKIKERRRVTGYYNLSEENVRANLERILQQKARFEKELEEVMQMEKWRKQSLEMELSELETKELFWRDKLKNVAKEKKRAGRELKELEKESTKPISAAMDEFIHNQEKFTCVAVFIISDDGIYSGAVLEERVVEKLASIPVHTKLVVSASEYKSIAEVPETLRVSYRPQDVLPFFTLMMEIFNNRWQTLDLISMMQELIRATAADYRMGYGFRTISVQDTLSSLPTFQKKEEEHSS